MQLSVRCKSNFGCCNAVIKTLHCNLILEAFQHIVWMVHFAGGEIERGGTIIWFHFLLRPMLGLAPHDGLLCAKGRKKWVSLAENSANLLCQNSTPIYSNSIDTDVKERGGQLDEVEPQALEASGSRTSPNQIIGLLPTCWDALKSPWMYWSEIVNSQEELLVYRVQGWIKCGSLWQWRSCKLQLAYMAEDMGEVKHQPQQQRGSGSAFWESSDCRPSYACWLCPVSHSHARSFMLPWYIE